jgi:hypothetical protein
MKTVRPIKPVTIIDDDDAIVSDEIAAAFLGGVHPDTLDSIPGMPPSVYLSPRRKGRRLGDVRRCARARVAASERGTVLDAG